MNIIIITGASSGMGKEFALQLDKIFYAQPSTVSRLAKIDEIWLISRRKKEMLDTARRMHNDTRVIGMDLTSIEDMQRLEKLLAEKKPAVRMLVNCAGYGVLGDFAKADRPQLLGMIDLNCRALTEMTHMCIPYMRKNSRIIQLASSAAFLPQPDFAVYAASKAYVYSFSRALARELAPRHIYVTSVCPGPVDTPFFDIAEKTGCTLAVKKLVMAKSDRVVRLAVADSFKKKEHSVYGIAMKGFELLTKAVPHSIILKLMKFTG